MKTDLPLEERIARGEKAVALAKEKGLDTSGWQAELERLKLLLAREVATTSVHQEVSRQVSAWAGYEPERWKRVHTALLRIYTPAWDRVDARDILVAWAAAWLALTRAKQELTRLESLQRPLGRRELDAKGGRQADVSFWGRLAHRLTAQAPTALAEDAKAAKVLAALVNSKHGDGE